MGMTIDLLKDKHYTFDVSGILFILFGIVGIVSGWPNVWLVLCGGLVVLFGAYVLVGMNPPSSD